MPFQHHLNNYLDEIGIDMFKTKIETDFIYLIFSLSKKYVPYRLLINRIHIRTQATQRLKLHNHGR